MRFQPVLISVLLLLVVPAVFADCCNQQVLEQNGQPIKRPPILSEQQEALILLASDRSNIKIEGVELWGFTRVTEFQNPPVLGKHENVRIYLRQQPPNIILETTSGESIQLKPSDRPGFIGFFETQVLTTTKEVELWNEDLRDPNRIIGKREYKLGTVRMVARLDTKSIPLKGCVPNNRLEFLITDSRGKNELGGPIFDLGVECKSLISATGFFQPFSNNHDEDEIVIEPREALLRDPQALLAETGFTIVASAPQSLLPFEIEGADNSFKSGSFRTKVTHAPIKKISDAKIRIPVSYPPIRIAILTSRYDVKAEGIDVVSTVEIGKNLTLTSGEFVQEGSGIYLLVSDYCGKNFPLEVELFGNSGRSYGNAVLSYSIDCDADVVIRAAPDVLFGGDTKYYYGYGLLRTLDTNVLKSYIQQLQKEGLKTRVEASVTGRKEDGKIARLGELKPKFLLFLGDKATTFSRKVNAGVKRASNEVETVINVGSGKGPDYAPPERADHVKVDDAIFGDTLEPTAVVGRIPGSQREVEEYLSRPRDLPPVLSQQPRIFSDICGAAKKVTIKGFTPTTPTPSRIDIQNAALVKTTEEKYDFKLPNDTVITSIEVDNKPDCFIFKETNVLSNKLYQKPCNQTAFCFFAPEVCEAIYDPPYMTRYCEQEATLNKEFARSTTIFLNGHGAPDSIGGFRTVNKSGKDVFQSYTIFGNLAAYKKDAFYSPLIFSDGCSTGAIGGLLPRSAITRGARAFIAPAHLAYGVETNNNLYLKMLELCAKQGKTIGEAFFQVKTEEAKRLKTQPSSADTQSELEYNIAELMLYGDPTLKCA